MYVMDVTHRNHQFIKIDKKNLYHLFKKANKVMYESNPNKSISEMLRIMLILSTAKMKKTKEDLKFFEEIIYFVKCLEKEDG